MPGMLLDVFIFCFLFCKVRISLRIVIDIKPDNASKAISTVHGLWKVINKR